MQRKKHFETDMRSKTMQDKMTNPAIPCPRKVSSAAITFARLC